MAFVDATRQITEYIDDFGRTYNNLPFKINQFYANDAAFSAQWSDREAAVPCSPGSLFTTRRLIVTFLRNDDDAGPVYETIQMPVANKSLVLSTAQALLGRTEVICIDYQGERWVRLPASLVPSPGAFDPNAVIPVALTGGKLSGTIAYVSDYAAATTTARYTIEAFPDDLSDNFLECVTGFSEIGICSDGANISTRRFVGKARKFFDGEVVPGTVVRSVPVSVGDPQGLLDCLGAVADNFVCAGYEGERVRNIQNLIALPTP